VWDWHTGVVQPWTVGGALIESEEGLLLVRNQRHGGHTDWTPPGGVIDHGEELLDGLAREVTEETGLIVADWIGPAYRIDVVAPDMGWNLHVEAWRAVTFEGELRVGHDPDGIVVEARFVPVAECVGCLGRSQPWVTDPVEAWLDSPWEGTRDFGYVVEGTDRRRLVVTRT
jgi:ADP-ribose pyrophosphatase YjhB (NUDIX family)